jgi:hypothetical protein
MPSFYAHAFKTSFYAHKLLGFDLLFGIKILSCKFQTTREITLQKSKIDLNQFGAFLQKFSKEKHKRKRENKRKRSKRPRETIQPGQENGPRPTRDHARIGTPFPFSFSIAGGARRQATSSSSSPEGNHTRQARGSNSSLPSEFRRSPAPFDAPLCL